MNSNNYNNLLKKYYSGLTSSEEERWLKKNAHLGKELVPLVELSADNPVMDWSFDEFLVKANQEQPRAIKGTLQHMQWIKYAAAIATIAILAIALYPTNPKRGISKQETALYVAAEVEKKEQLRSDSITPVNIVPLNNKAINRQTITKSTKHTVAAKPPKLQQENDDFFVMVNGLRITDEAEALAILQHSMNRLDGNLRETMSGINNFPKLDVKFK